MLTRMELLAYRREHGRLPERLLEIIAATNGINLVDPWSGHLFDYYPTFLLSTGGRDLALVPTSAKIVEFKNGQHGIDGAFDPMLIVNRTSMLMTDIRDHNLSGTYGRSFASTSVFPIPLQIAAGVDE